MTFAMFFYELLQNQTAGLSFRIPTLFRRDSKS